VWEDEAMNKQLGGRIVSAVFGLGCIAAGAWLSVQDADGALMLIACGVGVAGGLGTLVLPRVTEPAEPPSPRTRKRRRGGMAPPLPVLLALGLLTGCGASALSIQADAAALTGRVVAEADTAMVRVRAAELDGIRDDARAACPTGCPERAEYHLGRLAEAEARWRPVLDCRAPVVEGLRAWIDAIELAATAATESLGLSHALAEAARVVLLYSGMRECVGDAVDLPELPEAVTAYAEGVAL
jgi:hypothetical protein